MTQKPDDGLHGYVKDTSSSSFINEMRISQVKLHNHIEIYVKNPLPKEFALEKVLQKVEHTIPASLMQDVDAIIIGDFQMLKARDMDAVYEDGAIYLTNEQKGEDDMYDDIVHEVAHAAGQGLALVVGQPVGGQVAAADRRGLRFHNRKLGLLCAHPTLAPDPALRSWL